MSSEDPPFFNEGNQTVIEQQPDYGSDHFDEPEENLVQSNNTLQEQVDAPANENEAQSGTRASAGDGTYATLGPQGSGNVDQPEGNRLIPPDINDPNSLIFWEMKVRQEDTDHHKHLTLEDILWNLHEARVTDANYQQVFESTVLKEISNYIKSGPKGVKSHAVGPDKPWFYSQAHRNNLLQGWFSDWMRLPEGKVHFMHFQSAQELGRSELTHQLLYMPSGAYYEDTAGKVWYIPNGYLWIGEFTKDSIFNIFEYFQQEIDRDLLNVFWRKIAPIAFFSIEKYRTDMSELREEYNQLVQEPNFDNAPNKQTLPAGFLVVLKDIQTMNIYRVSEGVWVDDISDLPLGYTSQRITKVYGKRPQEPTVYYIPYCAFKENGTDGWHSSLRGYLVLNDPIDFRTFTDREIARIEDNKLYYPFVAQGLIVHAFLVLQPYLMVHMVQELIRHQLMTEAEVPPKFFDIPTEEELNEHIHPREVTKLKLLIDWFLDKADKFFKVSWYVYKKQILSRIRNWNYDILRFYPIHEVPEDAIEGEVVKQFLQQEPEVVKMCLYIAHPPHDKSWVTWREEVLRPPIGTEPEYSEMLEELDALGVIEEIKEAMLKRRYELFFEIQEYIMKCKWVKLGFPVLRVLHGKFDDFVAASLLVAQPELMALCLSFVHLNFVPYPEVLVGFTEETPFSTDVLQGVLKLLEMIHDDEWSLKDSILNRLKSQKPLLECLLNVSLGYLRAPSSVRKAMLKVEDHDPQVIREILCAIELLELGPREFQSASQASSSGHSSVLGTNISSPEAPETRSPAMRRRVVSDMGPVSHVASGLRSQVSRRQGIVSESESPDSGYSGAGSPLQRSLGMESLSPGTSNTASLSPGMFTPGQTSSQAFSPVKLRRPRPQTSEATSPIASGSSPGGDSATPMTNPSSDPYVTASGVRLRRKPGRGNTQNTSQLVSSGSSGEHPNCHQQ